MGLKTAKLACGLPSGGIASDDADQILGNIVLVRREIDSWIVIGFDSVHSVCELIGLHLCFASSLDCTCD